jgi:hypothetical protein
MAEGTKDWDWVAEVDKDQGYRRAFKKFGIDTPEKQQVALTNLDNWMEALRKIESGPFGNIMNLKRGEPGGSNASGWYQITPDTKDTIARRLKGSDNPALNELGDELDSVDHVMEIDDFDKQSAIARYNLYTISGSDPYLERLFDGDTAVDLYTEKWHRDPTPELSNAFAKIVEPGTKLPVELQSGGEGMTAVGGPLMLTKSFPPGSGRVSYEPVYDEDGYAGGGTVQTAKGLAALGRGPDNQLVHMAPKEVAALQRLATAAGGSLTINPETGLMEAGFLEDWLPTIVGLALAPMTGGLSTFLVPAAAGVGATAITGDWKQGLKWGLGVSGGMGMGSSLMGVGAGAGGALGPVTATRSGGVTAALNPAGEITKIAAPVSAGWGPASGVPTGHIIDPTWTGGMKQMGRGLLGQSAPGGPMSTAGVKTLLKTSKPHIASTITSLGLGAYDRAGKGFEGPKDTSDKPAGYPEDAPHGYMAPRRDVTLPQRPAGDTSEMSYFDPSPYPNPMGYVPYDPSDERFYAAGGGLVNLPKYQEGGTVAATPAATPDVGEVSYQSSFTGARTPSTSFKPSPFQRADFNPTDKDFGTALMVNMAGLGGKYTPPASVTANNPFFRPQGFGSGEARYSNPIQLEAPALDDTGGGEVAYFPRNQGAVGFDRGVPALGTVEGAGEASYFPKTRAEDMHKEATEIFRTTMMLNDPVSFFSYYDIVGRPRHNIHGGFTTPYYPGLHPKPVPTVPARQFMAAGGPVEGAGDGTSDSVPAKIDDQQPAALSTGEFVISADVVSGLGNGDTDAGAEQLYALMDRVRSKRSNGVKQPPTIRPRGLMPA